jgi:alpha-ketoglutarate-dependent taurine dioxygenase
MDTATLQQPLTAIELEPRIATEVKIDAATLASGVHATALRKMLEHRGVLIFREVHLNNEQQLDVARSLGTVVLQGDKGIQPLSMDKKINPSADYQRGAIYWHIDGACDGAPNFAAMLSGRTIVEKGGETMFANTYAAWDDLPEDEKKQLDGLRVIHSLETAQRMIVPQPGYNELRMWQSMKPRSQPLVWTHRDGRKSLVLGATASHVEGMGYEEGRLLLAKLLDWATQPQYVYTHHWKIGDLVVWDNTGTMHRVEPYDFNAGRLLYRTTLEGEEMLA